MEVDRTAGGGRNRPFLATSATCSTKCLKEADSVLWPTTGDRDDERRLDGGEGSGRGTRGQFRAVPVWVRRRTANFGLAGVIPRRICVFGSDLTRISRSDPSQLSGRIR